ncbi:MAG: glutamate--cysteine ligase, partial [Beijerinckiaceae bacterium]
MARDTVDLLPLSGKADLVNWIEKGAKPEADFRIGTEHEKIPFYRNGILPVPYAGPRGIRQLLEGMQGMLGWEPIMEGDHPIGLADVTGGGAISLEPGGQFELSGAPLATLHETEREIVAHLMQVKQVADPLGIAFLTLGFSPLWTHAQTPVMPKQRYGIMANYMPKVGTRGLDMMFRTTTVQVNLDFSSEADMVKKLRIGLALQPLATALFANSPFKEGRPNGFLSSRGEIWRDTDNARAGSLPFAFEDGMGYERYVDYALDVPMYFIKRGDRYIDATGTSFRDLLAGRHPLLPGETAVLSDWA